jgi:hypothetical protein
MHKMSRGHEASLTEDPGRSTAQQVQDVQDSLKYLVAQGDLAPLQSRATEASRVEAAIRHEHGVGSLSPHLLEPGIEIVLSMEGIH